MAQKVYPSTPVCGQCKEKLLANFITATTYDAEKAEVIIINIRLTGYGYKSENMFCSKSCGYSYGVKALEEYNLKSFGHKEIPIGSANIERGFCSDGTLHRRDLIKANRLFNDSDISLEERDVVSFNKLLKYKSIK